MESFQIKINDEYAINWSIEVDKYINKKNISTKTEHLHTDKRIISDQLKSIDKLNLNYEEDSIIWSTGFRYDYDWIDLDVTDDNNHPIQRRGVTKYKGLYFMGLQWMHSSKSAQFIGVAEDANFIVRDILSKNLL